MAAMQIIYYSFAFVQNNQPYYSSLTWEQKLFWILFVLMSDCKDDK